MSIYLTVGRSVGRSASLVFEGPVRPLAQLASSCPRRAKSGAYEISRIWQQPAGRPSGCYVRPRARSSVRMFAPGYRRNSKSKWRGKRGFRTPTQKLLMTQRTRKLATIWKKRKKFGVLISPSLALRGSVRANVHRPRSIAWSVGRRPPRGYFSELNFWPSAIPPESVACEVQSWGAPLNLSLFSLKLRWRREAM